MLLPPQFADLEVYAEIWGDLVTQSARYLQRQASSMQDLQAFHAAAAPRLEDVFTYLDQFPPDELAAADARLFRTMLGLTEASQAIEVLGCVRIPHAPYPHEISLTGPGGIDLR